MGKVINDYKRDIKNIDNSIEAINNIQHNNRFGIGMFGSVNDTVENRKEQKITDAFSTENLTQRGLSWNIAWLDEMMRKEAYILNATTWKAIKSLSNGIDLNIRRYEEEDNDVEVATKINDYMENHYKKPLIDFSTQGDQYGGAGSLIVIGDNYNVDFSKPLTPDEVKFGDKISLRTLTRLYQIQPILSPLNEEDMKKTGEDKPNSIFIERIGEDVGIYDSSELGKPKYYRVSISGEFFGKDENNEYSFYNLDSPYVSTRIVHRSRLLIYNSSELSWVERQVEQYFGVSIIVKALESIKRYKEALIEVMALLKRSNVPVLNVDMKLSGSKTSDMYLKQVDDTIVSYLYALDNSGVIVLGADGKEKLQFIQAEFKDLSNILLDRKKELSADLQAPVSVTFNEEPKIDEHISYYGVHYIQERQLRPAYQQLIPLTYKAVMKEGTLNQNEFSFKFKSLEYISEKDRGEQVHKAVMSVGELYEKDIINRYEAKSMLMSSTDNISDMLQEMKLEKVDKSVYSSDVKISIAEALNQSKENLNVKNGKTYNMAQSSVAGGELGGDNTSSKRKPIDIK